MNDILVVGGGAAGIMAAYAAATRGENVTLADKNDRLGKKLFITGKGRCNITNACDTQDFFRNVVRNPKFLMSAIYGFSCAELLELLERYGLKTKTERGGRVFPVSDKSSDVIRTLQKMLDDAGVKTLLSANVESIAVENGVFGVSINGKTQNFSRVIIATGGLSYPLTGSTGDGYGWAKALGHGLVQPMPALCPLEDQHNICARMQGLTLKNIKFTLYQNEKAIYTEQGELLFTHFGLSGPVVLSASCYIDAKKDMDSLHCEIDLKPALTEEVLEARLLRDFSANQNKQLKTYMPELLPSKLINPFLEEVGVDGRLEINRITKETRRSLLHGLKHFGIKIGGTRPIEEAIVTAGGVDVKQVVPGSMESRLVPGLYFAGEILDVSALTGGFNLQIAFSTGYLAGGSAAESIVEEGGAKF